MVAAGALVVLSALSNVQAGKVSESTTARASRANQSTSRRIASHTMKELAEVLSPPPLSRKPSRATRPDDARPPQLGSCQSAGCIDPNWGLEQIIGHLSGLAADDMTPFLPR